MFDVIGSAHHCQKNKVTARKSRLKRNEILERPREVTGSDPQTSTHVENSADEQALKKKRSQSGNPTRREVKTTATRKQGDRLLPRRICQQCSQLSGVKLPFNRHEIVGSRNKTISVSRRGRETRSATHTKPADRAQSLRIRWQSCHPRQSVLKNHFSLSGSASVNE